MRKAAFSHCLRWKEEEGSSQWWLPDIWPQMEEEGAGLGHEEKSREEKIQFDL